MQEIGPTETSCAIGTPWLSTIGVTPARDGGLSQAAPPRILYAHPTRMRGNAFSCPSIQVAWDQAVGLGTVVD